MDPKFECRATAALLRSASPLIWGAHAAAVIAGLHPPITLLSLASLLCWCAVLYLAVRVHFDAAAFDLLSEDPEGTPAAFDAFLSRSVFGTPKPDRDIAGRCRGATRLWRILVFSVIAQLTALGFALVLTSR